MLKGKVAIVTGASRGIGAAIARGLASHGVQVAVNYCASKSPAERVATSIAALGGKAMAVQADVTVRPQVESMVAAVEAELGPIDILVNNAAIGFPVVPFAEYPWEAFEQKLVGEAKASFFTCQ